MTLSVILTIGVLAPLVVVLDVVTTSSTPSKETPSTVDAILVIVLATPMSTTGVSLGRELEEDSDIRWKPSSTCTDVTRRRRNILQVSISVLSSSPDTNLSIA